MHGGRRDFNGVCLWQTFFRSLKDEHILRTMYCSLIRPNLEYCTVVFNSISAYQVQRIEKVQQRFLKFMYRNLTNYNDVIDMDYLDLCDRYRLSTLKHRRDINDCLFLYKHLHNCYNLTDANPYNLYAPARRTRHAPKQLSF